MGMTVEEQIKVQQAYLAGKEIQFKDIDSDNWEDTSSPLWNFTKYDYRVKQGLELPDSIENQQELVRLFLEKCKSPVYDYIIKWIADNTQHLESNEYIKQSDITYEYLKENEPDLIQEIMNSEPIDPSDMTDDEVEECARYWMNRASYDSIVEMIKEEA